MAPRRKKSDAKAWDSLNKTITEIMVYMEDDAPRANVDLRRQMYEKMADVVEYWIKEAYNWGHKDAYIAFRDKEEFPSMVENECSDLYISPSVTRSFSLKSKIKRV